MKKFILLSFFAAMLVPASASFAGNVNISIGIPVPPPPPLPVIVAPSPPRPVVVMPPPPPSIVIEPGAPVHWFWNDNRGLWFYYDSHRRPHYSRRHVYVDDGRHYYSEGGKWHVGRHDMGKHKGWYKHKEKRERKERRHEEKGRRHGRGHDRDEN